MKQTDILGLKKPDLTDFYNVGDFNENADKIDDAVKDLKENKTNKTDFSKHTGNKENPHGVTKSQIGLGSVPNVATNDQTPTFSVASTRANIVSGEKLSVIMGKIMKFFSDLKAHAFKDLVNNLTTSTTGNALDASQGKLLQDEVDGINSNLSDIETNLEVDIYNVNDVIVGKYVIDKDCSTGTSTSWAYIPINVNGLDKITISALGGSASWNKHYFNDGTTIPYNNADVTVEVPSTASILYVNVYKEHTDLNAIKITTNSNGKIVSEINASLDAQGLLSVFDGELLQGYWKGGSFGTESSNNYICSKTMYPCNSGDRVNIKNNLTNNLRIEIIWLSSSSALSSVTPYNRGDSPFQYVEAVAPSDAKFFVFNIGSNDSITPTTAGKIELYVNNDIATIKKDLGEQKEIYSDTTINVGRQAGTTVGDNSTAEGADTEASGDSSHSEGWLTTASNDCSHAEGNQTGASGIASHSEGTATGASGDYSHAEGDTTTASGESSHAEGKSTKKAFDYINEKTSTSDIQTAWASNKFSIAKGESAHVEGNDCLSLGDYSHAEGFNTIANNNCSHAEGNSTKANGFNSHAEGFSTIALNNQHAQGHYNNNATATENSDSGTSKGTAFVIGNGTYSSKSNAFRITGEGVIYSTNSSVQTGADYAEYFEWSDENPDSEDRVGYFVTLDEDNPEKIRIANNGDYILGIVSGMPSVIGNGDECWKQRYILDEFGRYIVEEFEYEVVVGVDEETGKEIKETKIGTKWKENPDYDSTKPYIPRKERAEWSAIGMVGVLSVYDDGSCKVNGYCKVADGGIATEAEKGDGTYRVIKRVNENIVKIVLK